MGQALYSKAAEITGQHQQMYLNIVFKLGVFHTICNSMMVFEKRFQDAGLKNLLIEFGAVAKGSISGKDV
jgi:hypothetical protein